MSSIKLAHNMLINGGKLNPAGQLKNKLIGDELMFSVLLWKEIREHLMTFRFATIMITTFVLLVTSVWMSANDFVRRNDASLVQSEMSDQELKTAIVPSRLQPTLYKSPSKLGIFIQGEEKRLGDAVQIKRWEIPLEATTALSDNEFMAAVPPFDFLTILTFVTSLFGILISYDTISSEKEKGTLKMISTCQVSKGLIYGVKFLSGTSMLSATLLISGLCSMMVLLFVFNINFTLAEYGTIALIFLSGIIFGAFFIALGILTSVMSKKSSISLVISIFFWTLFVLVLPSSAVGLAGNIVQLEAQGPIKKFEIESRDEANKEIYQFWLDGGQRAFRGNGVFQDLGETSYMWDGSPSHWMETRKYVVFREKIWQDRAYEVYNMKKRLVDSKKQQKKAAEFLSFLSPAYHLRVANSRLAGTDYETYDRFLELSRKYREELMGNLRQKGYFGDKSHELVSQLKMEDFTMEKFQERMNEFRRKRAMGMSFMEIVNQGYGNMPPEGLVPDTDISSLIHASPDVTMPFVVMMMMVIILFALGYVAFLRYDVR